MNTADFAESITANTRELRLAWRSAVEFDDIASMHVTDRGADALEALAGWSRARSITELHTLLSSPPWTGNDSQADSPTVLVLGLHRAMHELLPALASEINDLIAAITSRLDHVTRERTRQLEHRVSTDALTGALSRSVILELLDVELSRGSRYAHPLSVIYLDVDSLKTINDTRGHPAGDLVLHRLAQTVMSNTRASDRLGRLGGDEFLLVLPETDSAGTAATASKLRSLLVSEGLGATLGSASSEGGTTDAKALIAAADADMRSQRA